MPHPELLAQFVAARRPLVALDYDGTLVGFKPTPEAAAPDPVLRRLLGELAGRAGCHTLIVSGRDRETLENWFGTLHLHLSAEHGLWLKPAGQDWSLTVDDAAGPWLGTARRILEDYCEAAQGTFVEEKTASVAWHYRRVPASLGPQLAADLTARLRRQLSDEGEPVEILQGACVVEVRRAGVHKGLAYESLLQRSGAFDFILAVGDDRTDEDLFATLPERAWTVKVREGATRARYRLASSEQVRALLTWLVRR